MNICSSTFWKGSDASSRTVLQRFDFVELMKDGYWFALGTLGDECNMSITVFLE
jgi:hypothetical protein